MLALTAACRLPFALICILGLTLVTTAFPQPRITFTSGDASGVLSQDGWDVVFHPVALSDWTIQMMSSPSLGEGSRTRLRVLTPRARDESAERSWPGAWASGAGLKRNVVADDAAFRERSKLLTSMERQKWLNSYMQKLLVVNSSVESG